MDALDHLDTPRLALRPLAVADVDALWPFVSDPTLPYHMTWEVHRDRAETLGFVRQMEEARQRGVAIGWAIRERGGTLCGTIGLHDIERQVRAWRKDRAELGYWIGAPFRERGYVTEAGRAVMQFAFGRLGLHKVTVGCIAENAASKRVIEKLGFRAVGVQRDHAFRHGRWWDHLSFELTAPEWHELASRTTPA